MFAKRNLPTALCLTAIVAACSGPVAAETHPDSSGWQNLLAADLSNAVVPKDVWSVDGGVLSATKDECLWTKDQYENFVLDLEFKNAEATNSGVIVYCSDLKHWIPNSVEIQIADDFASKWSGSPKTWQCAAIFGRQAPNKSLVKRAGEWNRMTITCRGQQITVMLNGEVVTDINMKNWTSATKNPDGSAIPPWLSRPMAELATKGHIGFQGKHGGAPIYFRNMKIKAL